MPQYAITMQVITIDGRLTPTPWTTSRQVPAIFVHRRNTTDALAYAEQIANIFRAAGAAEVTVDVAELD